MAPAPPVFSGGPAYPLTTILPLRRIRTVLLPLIQDQLDLPLGFAQAISDGGLAGHDGGDHVVAQLGDVGRTGTWYGAAAVGGFLDGQLPQRVALDVRVALGGADAHGDAVV